MINKIPCCPARSRPQGPKATMMLQRCLLRGLLVVALLANIAAAATASLAQSSVTADGEPAHEARPGSRHLVNARVPPYRAIGLLTGPVFCTGAIVLHPQIVVTTAHCVLSIRSSPSSRLVFRSAYQDGESLGIFEAKVEAIGSARQHGVQSVHDASQDWAILMLNRTPAGIRPLHIVEHTVPELQSLRGRILMPSYSRDLGHGQALSVAPSCSIKGSKWEVLVHDCGADAGSAGAPLLIRDQDCYGVAGIHSGAMLVDDNENHTKRLVGNSAIGTWNFVDHVHVIATRLDADKAIDRADRRAPTACPFETADYHVGHLSRSSRSSIRFRLAAIGAMGTKSGQSTVESAPIKGTRR